MNPLVRRLAHKIESSVSGRLVQPWREHRRFEEHYLARLLKYLNIDCVFDVGANTGLYALMLREYCGYEGLIISFEPTPAVAAQLKQNSAGDSQWVVRECALGLAKGKAVFRTMDSSEGNSFLPLRREEAKDIAISEITVDVERLAEVFPGLQEQYKFRRPFLKMDTQGYDGAVFRGVGKKLEHVAALQSEVSVISIYDGMPHWTESVTAYEQAGFGVAGLFPVTLDGCRVIEFDCLMVRASPKA